MTVLGAGMLWFGWFGFNAGSALASGQTAAVAFMTTHLGASGGALGWLIVEWAHRKKPTALGVASGLVAGLVGITPAAGFVAPWAAIIIGLAAGTICYGAVVLKTRMGYDDALDAFGIHGIGGFVGAILTGVFAQASINGAAGLIDGNPQKVWVQLVASFATIAYSVVCTLIILLVVKAVVGLRAEDVEESEGLDITQHGEEGYSI
jgi:Amt family ammonium transporter